MHKYFIQLFENTMQAAQQKPNPSLTLNALISSVYLVSSKHKQCHVATMQMRLVLRRVHYPQTTAPLSDAISTCSLRLKI